MTHDYLGLFNFLNISPRVVIDYEAGRSLDTMEVIFLKTSAEASGGEAINPRLFSAQGPGRDHLRSPGPVLCQLPNPSSVCLDEPLSGCSRYQKPFIDSDVLIAL
jgi:hypothetical protein